MNPSNNTKIIVQKAGKYKIDFEIFFLNLATAIGYVPIVHITKNGIHDPRTKFAMSVKTTSGNCLLLTGTAIINVPTDNTTLQLINITNLGGDSSNISTCDNGPVATAINLVKVV